MKRARASIMWMVIWAIVLIGVLALIAVITPAQAQQMPITGPYKNADGEVIGTVTMSGNRFYIRDLTNELIAQIVIERDGTRTMYDPNGKVLDQKLPLPGKK